MRWAKFWLGLVACLAAFLIGALLGVFPGRSAAEGQMLASGAIVLGYMLIGGVIASVVVGYLAWRWPLRRVQLMTLALVLAAASMAWFMQGQAARWRAERELKRQQEPQSQHVGAGSQVELPATAVDRQAAPGEAIEGFGFVSVPFGQDGLRLYFYDGPELNALVVDSLAYDRDGNLNVLRSAPPYLKPYYLKEDYESLIFRLRGMNSSRVEIDLNADTGQRGWVDRDAVNVRHWPDFLADVALVYPLDPQRNPVRRRPVDDAPTADFPEGTLWVSDYVSGDWIRVLPILPNGDQPPIPVWLRWRREEILLAGWDYRL